MRVLRVTVPFADYAVGDEIPAGDEAARVLSCDQASFVTVVEIPPLKTPDHDE